MLKDRTHSGGKGERQQEKQSENGKNEQKTVSNRKEGRGPVNYGLSTQWYLCFDKLDNMFVGCGFAVAHVFMYNKD